MENRSEELLYRVQQERDIIIEVYKEHKNGEYKISAIEIDSGTPRDLGSIQYQDVGEEYYSPYLSWYNCLFCSNCYFSIAPDASYMNNSVQNGKKLVATVTIPPTITAERFLSELPESCGYETKGKNPNTALIFRKGCLSDYFDCDKITELYRKHGIIFDSIFMKNLFNVPIQELVAGAADKLEFILKIPANLTEKTVLTGLLLGYPLESTVEYILKDKT